MLIQVNCPVYICLSVQAHVSNDVHVWAHTCRQHTHGGQKTSQVSVLAFYFEGRSLCCSLLHIPHYLPVRVQIFCPTSHLPIRALRLQMHASHDRIQVVSAQKHFILRSAWYYIPKQISSQKMLSHTRHFSLLCRVASFCFGYQHFCDHIQTIFVKNSVTELSLMSSSIFTVPGHPFRSLLFGFIIVVFSVVGVFW